MSSSTKGPCEEPAAELGPTRARLTRGQAVFGVLLILAIAILALVGYGATRQPGDPLLRGSVNAVGEQGRERSGPAPDFRIRLFQGGSLRLSEQQSHPVLINFWASWCVPCRQEAPVLERAWRQYQGRGVVFIGLDLWDQESDARAFIREFGITYPNGPDVQSAAALRYGVTGIPETFLIRPDGTIARHWIGPLTDKEADAFISQLL